MSRKHSRNSDLLAQLGEPLPLPYKPQQTSSSLKDEDSSDTILRHEPVRSVSEQPIRRRLFSSGYPNDSRLSEPEASPPAPPTLPLWRRKYSIDKTPVEPSPSQAALDTIEQKIEELRNSCGSNEQIDKKIEGKLRTIESDLDKLIEESREASILEELEKLQQLSKPLHESQKRSLNPKLVAAGVVLLVLFGTVSFWLGHMSYEYCYYWC
ncbi:hypothetical protein FT663_03310 [Candidozyma haemuli var. vulneris]|uniref:Uncharacterized protein n=1 Tax=Candidozyma haemuli TaxID=45357 RepID=A0A2V1AWS8_9ASCO|nr:hypothetical protein CXQ85_000295 [[Candida] haemuloni]KAF3988458.1 hypothetical protein FT662_03407 [[Candida] haemuloni var. vulneris]KAF3990161.1 hypothetical protein FT663_03310 [[Candida] haemuloni var. vulneris]PVH21321.1 hypothetical protein CXQ85_000295 [[Candida] haemuloni]